MFLLVVTVVFAAVAVEQVDSQTGRLRYGVVEVRWLRHLLHLLQLKAPARYISKRDAVFLKHVTGIYRPYIGFDLRYFNQV